MTRRWFSTRRREIRLRTVFNLLGPLTNPAGASAQIVGVYSLDLVEKVAEALSMLGTHRAFVVHGLDGLDEITITGPTRVAEVRDRCARLDAYASLRAATQQRRDELESAMRASISDFARQVTEYASRQPA